MNKKILFITLVLALALSSCTTFKNQTLQIAGAETITEWQAIDMECQETQECIDVALKEQPGATLQDIEGRIRCNNHICEVKIERNIQITNLE